VADDLAAARWKDRLMTRYVALLRGINVAGSNKIAMADLRALLTAMGYADVVTYLHSGNAVFTAWAQPAEVMARAIQDGITAALGTRVKVVIRTAGQLAAVVAGNPLGTEPGNPSRFFVAFLSAAVSPAAAYVTGARASGGDRVWVNGSEAFLWCPKGFSVLVHTSEIEKTFAVIATTRNWNTVTKLATLANT
jgi:uncharacterized protein (DUF1697 family)